MRHFSDITEDVILDGDKITLDDIINQEVTILAYSIKTSRYGKNKSGKYLTLQVVLNDVKYVVFTGSDVLIEQMEKYGDQTPFLTTVRKIKRYYSLS